ncbi:MAG: LPS assembly lipoprotein LptE [Psychromonas sp.]|nr:LPS assembly lipoprotein LptE [Psychromonas sp.]
MHFNFINAFYRKIGFILLSLIILSGCGFHLKHNNGLAEKYPQLYLQSNNPNGELIRLIKIRLRGAGIKIASEPADDIAILKVGGERTSSRTISLYVTAQNAEKELSYNLDYSIQNPGYPGKSFTFNLYRDFLDDSAQALAKSREEELLETEMRSIAAEHIMTTMLSLKNEKTDNSDNKDHK